MVDTVNRQGDTADEDDSETPVYDDPKGCCQLLPFFAIMLLNSGMNFAFYGALTTAQVGCGVWAHRVARALRSLPCCC